MIAVPLRVQPGKVLVNFLDCAIQKRCRTSRVNFYLPLRNRDLIGPKGGILRRRLEYPSVKRKEIVVECILGGEEPQGREIYA